MTFMHLSIHLARLVRLSESRERQENGKYDEVDTAMRMTVESSVVRKQQENLYIIGLW